MGSAFYSTTTAGGGPKGQCTDQQCAEDDCDPDECGDEKRAPRDDNFTCGVDRRPLLPVLLITSTLVGALHMVMLQFPIARDVFDGAYYTRAFILALYVTTLGCMAYCALCDPGQLRREEMAMVYSGLRQTNGVMNVDSHLSEDFVLPPRAHKTWLYKLPIRRYDHYCRWLTNVIGLLNHREFMVMLLGLNAIGVSGVSLDLFLVFHSSHHWGNIVLLLMHLTYSVMLLALAGPILRLHIGFVMRNELANDWKNNEFYVITRPITGKAVPVNDLPEEEFNEMFDHFQYDSSRNPFDKGPTMNCWNFWCRPRWSEGQMGSF